MACYVVNFLKATILSRSPNNTINEPEYIILEISTTSQDSILYSCLYRRPKGILFNSFIHQFNNFYPNFRNVILAGDMNCDLSSNNFESSYFKNMASSLALKIVPSEPTHHTAKSNTWLDVFIVDNIMKVTNYDKTDTPFIAGQDLLSMSYSVKMPSPPSRQVYWRDYRNIDIELLNSLVSGKILPFRQQFDSQSSSYDIEYILDGIEHSILQSLEHVAPLRTSNTIKHKTPWITEQLKIKIKHRNHLYKCYRRSNTILNYQIFKAFRNKLSIEMRSAKHQYYFNKLEMITDPAVLWRQLASLGLVSKSTLTPFRFFTTNQLIQFYSKISDNTVPCSQSDLENAINLIPLSITQLQFKHVDNINVYQLLLSTLSNAHSSGPDSLSPYVIKLLTATLSPLLTSIYNYCIENSIFPNKWKSTIIKPLLKINPPLSPSDTTPIANLSELSKIFEKIIHNQVIEYLEQNNTQDKFQSGYRKKYSTQTALLKLCHDVRKSADNRRITILVLFDFSKAFDMVSHKYLLNKLASMGFSSTALKWVYSYLTDRVQYVMDTTTNSKSNLANVNIGVPQGSVLGPLLFSLFINDIGDSIRNSNHILFADDLQMYSECLPSELPSKMTIIREDIQAIVDYADNNLLKLNLSKTKIMILGSPAYVNEIDFKILPEIIVKGQTITFVTHARNLGVLMQSNLSWNMHVSNISSRVHGVLYKLKHQKNALSTSLRIKLVTTLIFPIIDYCCVVYNDITAELNVKLQRLINCTIRFIFNLKQDVHITPYRHRLK